VTDTTSGDRIVVQVQTAWLPDHSAPDEGRYAFSYTITIENAGDSAAQLISRHWIITDADGVEQEVRGDGVIGEQPRLAPGERFRYTSGAVIRTPVGSMRGAYEMEKDDGSRFKAQIPPFTLARPGTLN
jgi:ApaG protein